MQQIANDTAPHFLSHRTLYCIVAIRNADVRRGGRLLGHVDAWFLNESYVRESTEQRAYELLLTALHEKPNDSEIEALAAEGAKLSQDHAVAEAFAV
ncbi:MAG: hypothetical protein WAK11_08820 [Candidatus Cybelea sp.]